MKARGKIGWMVFTALLLFLCYKGWSLAEENHTLKQENIASQDRSNHAFSYLFQQMNFEDYANLLDQISLAQPDGISPKLDQISTYSNEMRDRLYTLYLLQAPIQQTQTDDFLIQATQARLFPVVYWIQKTNELEQRDIQSEDIQLFREIAKKIHEYDQQLSTLQELQVNQLQNDHIKESFLQRTTQLLNDMKSLIHDYEIKNNLPNHI